MASFTLHVKQNFNGDGLVAFVASDVCLNTIADKFLIKASPGTTPATEPIASTTFYTTNSQHVEVGLGTNFVNNTSYTVQAIGMDSNDQTVDDQNVSVVVKYFTEPSAVTLTMDSTDTTASATATIETDGERAGDKIDHFLVEIYNQTTSASGTKSVDRTAGSASTVLFNDSSFADVSFNNGDLISILVTAFTPAGNHSPYSRSSVTLSKDPNEFTFNVTQPVTSPPAGPSFKVFIKDESPIVASPLTNVTLTITQGSTNQIVDLSAGTWDGVSGEITITSGSTSLIGGGDLSLEAGTSTSLNLIKTNTDGSSNQDEFTYNGIGETSSFTPQLEAEFNADVTAANLANTITDNDIIASNEIKVQLSKDASLNALGANVTDLFNANGSDVSLNISILNASNAIINSLDRDITDNSMNAIMTFDLGGSYDQVKIRLSTTSTYDDASASTTDISSTPINLVNALLAFTVSAPTQMTNGATTLSTTVNVGTSTDHTSDYAGASGKLFLNKNNSGNYVDLNGALAAIKVSDVSLSTLDGSNNGTLTFNNLPNGIDGHGLYISVTGTQNSSLGATHDYATVDTSDSLVYKFRDPVLSWDGSGNTDASMVANGNDIVTVVDIDGNTDGSTQLNQTFTDNSGTDTGELISNEPYNQLFTDPENNNDFAASHIDISGINVSSQTLLVFTRQPNVSGNGRLIVSGSDIKE